MQTPGHLSDIFRTGAEHVIVDDAGNEYPIWIQRPSGLQQDTAREHANAKTARYKLQTKDKTSDTYMTLKMHVDEQKYEDALDARVKFDEPETREAALNQVLYQHEEGEENEWSEDGKYLAVLNAISARAIAIDAYNAEMEEAGSAERIDPDEDSELQEVMAEHERFQAEVEDIIDKELDRLREHYRDLPEETLRREILENTFDLDSRMQWYEAYQVRMLAFACRFLDDHRKFYFDSPDDMYEVPMYIRNKLFEVYNEIERGSDDVKNSLSLLNS